MQQVIERCAKFLQIDIVRHEALHFLHVNLIWALLEDASSIVKEMSEMRVVHNMNIEDSLWDIDERIKKSTPERIIGFKKFFIEKQYNASSHDSMQLSHR